MKHIKLLTLSLMGTQFLCSNFASAQLPRVKPAPTPRNVPVTPGETVAPGTRGASTGSTRTELKNTPRTTKPAPRTGVHGTTNSTVQATRPGEASSGVALTTREAITILEPSLKGFSPEPGTLSKAVTTLISGIAPKAQTTGFTMLNEALSQLTPTQKEDFFKILNGFSDNSTLPGSITTLEGIAKYINSGLTGNNGTPLTVDHIRNLLLAGEELQRSLVTLDQRVDQRVNSQRDMALQNPQNFSDKWVKELTTMRNQAKASLPELEAKVKAETKGSDSYNDALHELEAAQITVSRSDETLKTIRSTTSQYKALNSRISVSDNKVFHDMMKKIKELESIKNRSTAEDKSLAALRSDAKTIEQFNNMNRQLATIHELRESGISVTEANYAGKHCLL